MPEKAVFHSLALDPFLSLFQSAVTFVNSSPEARKRKTNSSVWSDRMKPS